MLLVPLALGLAGLTAAARAEEAQVITPPSQVSDAFKQFAAFFEILGKSYVDAGRLRPNEFTTAALRAYLRGLDPEAALLPPPSKMATASVGDGPLVDIGLSVSTRNQYPTVITPHEASPSQLAGLLWGDQIRAINGRSLDNADLGECYLLMWGAVNSAVELTVYDPVSATTRPVVIQRTPPKAVPRPTVKFIAGGVAYRRLPEFTVAAVEALREDLIRLEKERSRGLILDIRNNPGGVFEAMQVAAKMFLPQGATIVTVEYPDPSQRAVFISDDTHKFTMPVAVLVNGGTSSEAEIFAAALHDNKRAQLVGSATFGKGRKIGQFPMPDGAMLYIPVARYVPPSGKDYHGTGLTPHLAVDIPRATERKMATDGFGAFDWLEHRQAILATDKPLARALDALLNQR